MALVRWKAGGLAELPLYSRAPIFVIEAVEKPGNLGAIFRSADATGIAAVVVADGRTDPANPAVIRSSLGTVFPFPWPSHPHKTPLIGVLQRIDALWRLSRGGRSNGIPLTLPDQWRFFLVTNHSGFQISGKNLLLSTGSLGKKCDCRCADSPTV